LRPGQEQAPVILPPPVSSPFSYFEAKSELSKM